MRTLLKVAMNVEAANRAIRDGALPKLIESTLAGLAAEATYFTAENGKRTMYVVFDLKEPAQIPTIAEPLFQALQAEISMAPVMSLNDVKAGLARATQK